MRIVDTGGEFLEIMFPWAIGMSDLDYEIEESVDFSIWTPIENETVGKIDRGDTEDVTFRFPLPLADSPNRFYRLAASPPDSGQN